MHDAPSREAAFPRLSSLAADVERCAVDAQQAVANIHDHLFGSRPTGAGEGKPLPPSMGFVEGQQRSLEAAHAALLAVLADLDGMAKELAIPSGRADRPTLRTGRG